MTHFQVKVFFEAYKLVHMCSLVEGAVPEYYPGLSNHTAFKAEGEPSKKSNLLICGASFGWQHLNTEKSELST